MSIREGTDKRVSFDTRDKLGDKIDKLTVVMSKLVATDNHERRPFKPQIYKSRGQNRSYGQGRYQPRSNDRNRSYGAGSNTRQSYQGNRFRGNFRGDSRQSSREVTEMKGMVTTTIETGTDQWREHLQEAIEGIEVLAMIGLDQGQELVQVGIG